VSDLIKAGADKPQPRAGENELAEAGDEDLLSEPLGDTGTDWSSVPAHYLLFALLAAVLWFYRAADAKNLGIAVGAVVVSLVASRVDRIRKLTSKLVSFETRPLLQARRKAEKATSQAEQAATEAQATARTAHAAASEAQQAASRALQAAESANALASRVAEALRALQEATVDLSGLLAENFAMRSRLGSPTFQARLNLAQKLEERLRSIGCSEAEATDATRILHQSISFDLSLKALNRCQRALSERGDGGALPAGFEVELRALYEKFQGDLKAAPLSEIRRIAAKYGLVEDKELGMLLRALDTFLATRQLPEELLATDGS
jgi:pyruvate/2-oxoglutarate dehydrogenase complex dihydrolipoamide acyltransferase (E2) component